MLPAALVLQASLGQVDWKHTGDSNHACNPSVDQLGWEAVQRQVKTDTRISKQVVSVENELSQSMTAYPKSTISHKLYF